METQVQVSLLFADAAEAVGPVLRRVGRASPLDRSEARVAFGHLGERLKELPIARSYFATLRNMLADAQAMAESGEAGAARWQLSQLQRRLQGLLRDWRSDTDPKLKGRHTISPRRKALTRSPIFRKSPM